MFSSEVHAKIFRQKLFIEKRRKVLKNQIVTVVLFLSLLGVASCATSPESLEEAAPSQASVAAAGSSSVLEAAEESEAEEAPIVNGVAPAFQKLQAKLEELGYEGIGLEHETEDTLAVLLRVFSDPALIKRRIKGVYTGGAMDYDPAPESLTIGGTSDVRAILSFIKKKVPAQKKK